MMSVKVFSYCSHVALTESGKEQINAFEITDSSWFSFETFQLYEKENA